MATKPAGDSAKVSSPSLERVARETILPVLDGFDILRPSPLDGQHRQASVLVFRRPIGDVLVGIQLLAIDEHEFLAEYVSMPLFAPTVCPTFQAVGMERDGIRRLLRARRWVLDGRHDSEVLDRLAAFVAEEGIPILRRRSSLESFADELVADPHELESDPTGTEIAAYARILRGKDETAIALLETLIGAKGRGWLGETEISQDQMNALKERSRRMIVSVREDRPAALAQLRRWRAARLEFIGLDAD